MPFGLGVWEIIVLIGVLLLVVGPAKAPGVARMFGRGVREVRETVEAPKREITAALADPFEPPVGRPVQRSVTPPVVVPTVVAGASGSTGCDADGSAADGGGACSV